MPSFLPSGILNAIYNVCKPERTICASIRLSPLSPISVSAWYNAYSLNVATPLAVTSPRRVVLDVAYCILLILIDCIHVCIRFHCRVFGLILFTCDSLPLTMLSDSSVARKFSKLLSFSVCRWEWENCKCCICTPAMNISGVRDVTARSKSYTDSDWMGVDINWSVECSDTAVGPGHSRNRPKRRPQNILQNYLCILGWKTCYYTQNPNPHYQQASIDKVYTLSICVSSWSVDWVLNRHLRFFSLTVFKLVARTCRTFVKAGTLDAIWRRRRCEWQLLHFNCLHHHIHGC